jgi:microcystin-dependent protein
VLWQFAQDEGLVAANLFTVGDGSTTFGLPNFAGRTILGVGTGAGGTYALASIGGSITQLLTTAMMPVHNHGSVANHSHGTGDTNTVGHNHGFTTDSEPNHGAHVSADNVNHAVGTGGPHGHTPVWGANLGGHNHGGTTANTNHTHTVTMDPGGGHTHSDNGGTTPVPILQPYIAVNWLIYV